MWFHTPPWSKLELEVGSEAQEIPEGKGVWTIKITIQGVNFELSVKIAAYRSGRSFFEEIKINKFNYIIYMYDYFSIPKALCNYANPKELGPC